MRARARSERRPRIRERRHENFFGRGVVPRVDQMGAREASMHGRNAGSSRGTLAHAARAAAAAACASARRSGGSFRPRCQLAFAQQKIHLAVIGPALCQPREPGAGQRMIARGRRGLCLRELRLQRPLANHQARRPRPRRAAAQTPPGPTTRRPPIRFAILPRLPAIACRIHKGWVTGAAPRPAQARPDWMLLAPRQDSTQRYHRGLVINEARARAYAWPLCASSMYRC